MKFNKQSIYLALAGLVLIAVGSFIALGPVAYLSQFQIIPGEARVDFFSELRGMGGALFIFGLYIALSAIRERHQHTALIIASLTFSAFVIFRLLGIVLDGNPGQGILVALIIELVLAFGAIVLLTNEKAARLTEAH